MGDGRPEEPSLEDCCHNGCSPCVFDIFEKNLAEWSERNQKVLYSTTIRNDLLSETVFKPFILKLKVEEAKAALLLTFQAVSDDTHGQLPYRPGHHVVLRHPECSGNNFITRDYSLLPPDESHEPCCLSIVVKLYEDGVMSSYVEGLTVGSVARLRGPIGYFEYRSNSYKRVFMVCMGTGVVPMYTVAKDIVENEREETFVYLLYGCQNLERIILRDQLLRLLDFWNFRSWYCFSERVEEAKKKCRENFVLSRITEEIILDVFGSFEDCLVLICGSDEFNVCMKSMFSNRISDKNIFIF